MAVNRLIDWRQYPTGITLSATATIELLDYYALIHNRHRHPEYCCILCNNCLTDTLNDFYTHFFLNHASFRRDHTGVDHIIDRRFEPVRGGRWRGEE